MKETQEAVEGKPCVVKTYLGTEEDKDYSSIECIVAALQTVLTWMMRSSWRLVNF